MNSVARIDWYLIVLLQRLPDETFRYPFETYMSGTAGARSGIEGSAGFISHLAGTKLYDCFQFWCTQREHGQPPLKCRIDPTKMPRKTLPYLFIYELVEARFRCRLAGTEVVNAFREDPTGRYLDELLPPAAIDSRMRLFLGVVERVMPVVYGGRLAAGPNNWMTFKRLLLPVSKTGSAVDIVFGMVVFPQLEQNRRHPRSIKEIGYEFEAWATEDDLLMP